MVSASLVRLQPWLVQTAPAHPPGRFREDTVRAVVKLRERLDAIDAGNVARGQPYVQGGVFLKSSLGWL